MAVDIKSEFTRPLALILTALAALGWVLFILSSWSAASAQKTQRLQIMQLSEKADRFGLDLAKQREAAGALADLEAKVAATRDDLTRVSQTRNDVQAELVAAQKNLTSTKRDLTDTDRSLQAQAQKISELQTAGEEAVADATQTVTPKFSRGRRSFRRGRRTSRSFSIRPR